MPSWSSKQDEILKEFGSLGAYECQRIIERETGKQHSIAAVRKRASRIGASLLEYCVCPLCGRKTKQLTREGWCQSCHDKSLLHAQRVRNEQLRREVLGKDGDQEANRERRRITQSTYRLRQKSHKQMSKPR